MRLLTERDQEGPHKYIKQPELRLLWKDLFQSQTDVKW
jgi:hypothetical protein